MRVLLLYLSDSNDRREFSTTIAPISLFSIAAFLEKEGHEVTAANFSHVGFKKAVKLIAESAPDAVGISLLTHNRTDSLRLTKEIRKALPSVTIFAGGPHATVLAHEIAARHPEIDYIIRGEAETVLPSILSKDARPPRGIVEAAPVEDLSSLPSPASFAGRCRGINVNEQFKFIHAGRGHGSEWLCRYADSPFASRFRSAEAIVDEIESAHRRYGIIFFSFRDELFMNSRQLVLDVCRGIRERGLYIMWSAQSTPRQVDFSLLVEMKRAGCERLLLAAESGSPKILARHNPSITVEDILRASAEIRKAGLYLSFYLTTGLTEERHADILKTVRLIRQALPGDGIVAPAVYYPGSPACTDALANGTLSFAQFFSAKEKGVYIRTGLETREWAAELKNALSIIREKSWYTAKEFRAHRAAAGSTWVAEILEGDFHLDRDDLRRAEEHYSNVISMSQNNPWGYLRMGKLRFRAGDFPSAEGYYCKVTEVIPSYYGGWLKMCESQVAQNKRKEARASLECAWERNKWDPRVANLRKVL